MLSLSLGLGAAEARWATSRAAVSSLRWPDGRELPAGREMASLGMGTFAGICSLLSGRQVTQVIFRFKPSYRTTGEICHLAETPR